MRPSGSILLSRTRCTRWREKNAGERERRTVIPLPVVFVRENECHAFHFPFHVREARHACNEIFKKKKRYKKRKRLIKAKKKEKENPQRENEVSVGASCVVAVLLSLLHCWNIARIKIAWKRSVAKHSISSNFALWLCKPARSCLRPTARNERNSVEQIFTHILIFIIN